MNLHRVSYLFSEQALSSSEFFIRAFGDFSLAGMLVAMYTEALGKHEDMCDQ